MKIGLISDTHIPNRAKSIPKEFLDWFVEEKVKYIIHAGDVNDKEVIEELDTIAKTYVVKGNTDYLNLPKRLILKRKGKRILVFHSDGIYPRGDIKQLYEIAKINNVDIVIFGHTHTPFLQYYMNVLFINPGTATGVRSGEIANTVRSVAILEIDGYTHVRFKIL